MTHIKPRKNWFAWLGRPKVIDVLKNDLYEARIMLLDAEKSLEDWKAYKDTMLARVTRLEKRLRQLGIREGVQDA